MSVSVIITSAHESHTIGKAIKVILPQTSGDDEIIIITPDQKTIDAASKFIEENRNIRIIQDKDKGKPAAINLGIKNAKKDIIILTDGDVWLDDNALDELAKLFDDPKVGLVSGRPVSINSRDDLFGFWAYVLTDVAHQIREKRNNTSYQFIEASGYLLAFRKELIDHIPEESLAEDKVISQIIWSKGYLTKYAENAKVFVKYPDNYSDWLRQKIRSTGGSVQNIVKDAPSMRSFSQESRGVIKIFAYPENLKEFFWLIVLLFARLDLWLRIFINVKIKKLSRQNLWKRVESTK